MSLANRIEKVRKTKMKFEVSKTKMKFENNLMPENPNKEKCFIDNLLEKHKL